MKKSEHRRASEPSGTQGTATAPARQRVQRAPAPQPDDSALSEENHEARLLRLQREHVAGAYKVDARKVSAKIVDKHLKK